MIKDGRQESICLLGKAQGEKTGNTYKSKEQMQVSAGWNLEDLDENKMTGKKTNINDTNKG